MTGKRTRRAENRLDGVEKDKNDLLNKLWEKDGTSSGPQRKIN
jgi:hypothetical protein